MALPRHVAGAALGLVLLLPAAAHAQKKGDWSWSGSVAAGKTFEIRNINGDVHVGAASGDKVEVSAVKRARRGDINSVEIRVVEDADGTTICTVYPNQADNPGCSTSSNRRRHHDYEENNDVEVEFTVKLPARVQLMARTVNGSVDALGLGSDADVQSVNGDVEVETKGSAEASTVNGSVRATVGRAQWTGSAKFSSVNGDVIVLVPGTPNLDIDASTVNGDITSDFPMTITGRLRKQQLHGRIGNGGQSVSMTTVNGSVSLKKS